MSAISDIPTSPQVNRVSMYWPQVKCARKFFIILIIRYCKYMENLPELFTYYPGFLSLDNLGLDGYYIKRTKVHPHKFHSISKGAV